MVLDLRNFDFSYVTNLYAIFNAMPESAIIYVKDEYTQSKILSLPSNYRPSSWTTDNVVVAS